MVYLVFCIYGFIEQKKEMMKIKLRKQLDNRFRYAIKKKEKKRKMKKLGNRFCLIEPNLLLVK